jgi:hypothetical protein
MSRNDDRRQVRTTAAVRAAWGTMLLVLPAQLLRASGDGPVPVAAVTTARVLGLRHLLQAGVSAAIPTGSVAGLGAIADTVHASSMALLAAASPRWRRAALIDIVVESALATAGWRTGTRNR